MVDVAIDAMATFAASGANANCHGEFAAADQSDAMLEGARATVARFLGAPTPEGVWFGANMTTMTMAFTRAVEQTLRPGDRVVGTRLDHDANVSTWRIACERSGAEHVLAPFDVGTGRLDTDALVALLDGRTRWVAVTGASNLIGTLVDLPPIIDAAHAAGAHVFVDAVHLAPHRRIDVATLGVDALVTSPYKWYGPHAGAMWVEPELLDALPVAKVRPAPDEGPRRWETGTPSFEALAAVEAAARYLLDSSMDAVAASEASVFAPLLTGLQSIAGVRVWGVEGMEGRVPTVAFTVDGHHPDVVARALAAEKIAVWSGDSYAVEVAASLGLASSGGVVRAGVVRYIDHDDVQRLLEVVARLSARR
jgi:cysteine desulfurase family protein (TIGR01976 family)